MRLIVRCTAFPEPVTVVSFYVSSGVQFALEAFQKLCWQELSYLGKCYCINRHQQKHLIILINTVTGSTAVMDSQLYTMFSLKLRSKKSM